MNDVKDKSPNLREERYVANPFLMTIEKFKSGYKYYETLMLMKNVVGALNKITGRLAESGINILAGMHAQYKDEVLWLSFLEVPEDVSVEKALKEISSMDVVTHLRYERLDKTDRFDKFMFPLKVFDRRMVILTDYMFYGFRKAVIDVLKSGGEVIIYRQGLTSGEILASRLKERFKEELKTVEDTLRFTENAFRAFGWGIVEFRSIDPKIKTGSIIVKESMECFERSDIKCHFMRGVLTGVLRKIFDDENINLMEYRCSSRGDPYCEYRFV